MKTKLLKKIKKRFEIKVDSKEMYIYLFDKNKKEYTIHWSYTDLLDTVFSVYYKHYKITKRRRYLNARSLFNKVK